MSTLVAISLTTGILSGLWGWIAISFGLLSWAGFLGCTSYFASPTVGVKGLAGSLLTNMTGVFWAMVIIESSTFAGLEILGYVITAIVAFFMCIQAKQAWLGYIQEPSLAVVRRLRQVAIGNLSYHLYCLVVYSDT